MSHVRLSYVIKGFYLLTCPNMSDSCPGVTDSAVSFYMAVAIRTAGCISKPKAIRERLPYRNIVQSEQHNILQE